MSSQTQTTPPNGSTQGAAVAPTTPTGAIPTNGNGHTDAIEAVMFGSTPAVNIAKPKKARQNASKQSAPPEPRATTITGPISDDFVADYVKYADRFELPRRVHELVAIVAIAALLNGKVWGKAGGSVVPMDFWLLLLCGSGGGRNTTVRVMRQLLKAADIHGVLKTEAWGSFSAALQELADRGSDSLLDVWTEYSQVMQDWKAPHFRGIKQLVADCYDELETPQGKKYRDTGDDEKKKTPDIVFANGVPRLSFLATSSFAWLNDAVERTDITGGWLPRWCPIIAGEITEDNLVPWVEEADEHLKQPLVNKIKLMSQFSGIVNFAPWKAEQDKWYHAAWRRFHDRGALALCFFHRHRMCLYKLAVIAEVSRRTSFPKAELTISQAAWEQAIKWATMIEEGIFRLLERGFSQEGIESLELERRIEAAGPEGYSKRQFARDYRDKERKISSHRHLRTSAQDRLRTADGTKS
jgi:hypothetical protein